MENNTAELRKVRFTDVLEFSDREMLLYWRLSRKENKILQLHQVKDLLIGALRDWEDACPRAAQLLTEAICTKYMQENQNLIIAPRSLFMDMTRLRFRTYGDSPDKDYICQGPFKDIYCISFPEEYNTMISGFLSRRIEKFFPQVKNSYMSSSLYINHHLCPWNKQLTYHMNLDMNGEVEISGGDSTISRGILSCEFWI